MESRQTVKGMPNEFVKSMVSKNRIRYKDGDFNLDLSYITKRVIAMGYPAAGFYKLYRNDLSDVLKFFEKYHQSKVKIYNMCNDKFVDVNTLRLKAHGEEKRQIKLAYFPMMDHNPGPLQMIVKFAIDAVLYLARDRDNTIAVHCKAGKGRTGLAICAYLIFCEAT